MRRTCSELFSGLKCSIIGNPDEQVEGIAYRSDQVKEGDAFFCIVGLKVDGHTFAQDAIDRGAKVIVAERKLYLADSSDVTIVVVPDSRYAMGMVSSAFYDSPSEAFRLVGITGTNGKTTSTYLIEHIASHAGMETGVIGTIGLRIAGRQLPSDHTTPESPNLQRTFADMRDAGCQVVAMEVSSHALDLERCAGTTFAVTAFTNLTQDHLDYHHTFEAYFEAKAKLFSELYPAKRVINIDTRWGEELLSRCLLEGDDVITFSNAKGKPACDIFPEKVEYFANRTKAKLSIKGQSVDVEYPLVGKFNVENVMCAVACCMSLGISIPTIVNALRDKLSVPGRIEHVSPSTGSGDDLGFSVYVDYAHTPDALEKAIQSVREITPGNVICVFGCGGDRDKTKRPIMGRASLAADHVVVTSDNPRTEDPNAIIAEIVAGMGESASEQYEVEPDRAIAIRQAIKLAKPSDSVLIAGKGHEDYQVIGEEKIHFDDRETASLALDELLAASQGKGM